MENDDKDIEIKDESEESIEEEEEDRNICGDLLQKNTNSFKCLAQLTISRSSLFIDPNYWFPELEDPKLDIALLTDEPATVYDNIGRTKYIDICNHYKIKPYRRILNNLENRFMDLRFFGLNAKQMKALCEALETNIYVEILSLQENNLCPESVKYLDKMLMQNKTIKTLDLKECRIGPKGAENIGKGFALNKTITDLDISLNDLQDDGVIYLCHALLTNQTLRKLNLSHNNLGIDALIALSKMMEDNYKIEDLDLSFNRIYREEEMYSHTKIFMKSKQVCAGLHKFVSVLYGHNNKNWLTEFFSALQDNMALTKLNFSRCGLGDRSSMRAVYNYIRSDLVKIQDLDLNTNRITWPGAKLLKSGLKLNSSIVNLNLSSNPLLPSEVENLARTVLEHRDTPYTIKLMDFSNIMVNKNMVLIRNRCRKYGVKIRYEGVFSDYTLTLPPIKPIILRRAKYVTMNQKQKKNRQDFGVFLLRLEDKPIEKKHFEEAMVKYRIILDASLLEGLLTQFGVPSKSNTLDAKLLKETYLELYPDTKLPPEKEKKGKKIRSSEMISLMETMTEQSEDYTYGTEEMELETDELEQTENIDEEQPSKELSKFEKLAFQDDEHTEPSDLFNSVIEEPTDITTTEDNASVV